MIHIYMVGLGITSVSQVTREAEDVIRQSREVFYLDTGIATREYLQTLCPHVTSLYEQNYREGHPRLDAYHVMAATVVNAAIENAPVCFAVHGHPMMAVTAPPLVAKLARLLDLNVVCQPGISAVDTIFSDLGFDPLGSGIQMYEATDLLLRQRPLQTDVPALLWQIGSLESTLHTQRKSLPLRFKRLVDYLTTFYPPSHRVTAVYSAPHPIMESEKIECELARLGEHAAEIHAGFTLFVPATQQRPIRDLELLGKLSDPKHLQTLTR